MTKAAPWTIETAQPTEWGAAFDLALQDLDEPVRHRRILNALTLVGTGDIDPDGIFVARAADRLAGVLIGIPLQGAGGLVWPPQSRPFDPDLEDRLVGTALAWLASHGAKLAQALLTAEELPRAAALIRQGFRHVTRLRYLRHELTPVGLPSSRVRWEPFGPAILNLFKTTLLSTYDGSLDCPELNGVRTLEEIIAGHIAQGRFDPQRWWLAWEADQAVGVLLTTQIPDGEGWDLSYMGVVPAARGRGLGRDLTLQALHAARAAGAPELLVAVDERNRPALQLYQSLGFASVGIREVLLHILPRSLAAEPAAVTRSV